MKHLDISKLEQRVETALGKSIENRKYQSYINIMLGKMSNPGDRFIALSIMLQASIKQLEKRVEEIKEETDFPDGLSYR